MFDWKKTLAAVAPGLASALGGPLAGAAAAALSEKLLGKPDGKIEDIAAAVAGATPEQLLKLRELEGEFRQQMAQAGIDLEKIEAQDRADARARQVATKDPVPNILACVIVLALIATLGLMFGRQIPDANRDAFHNLLGILEGAVLSVMNFEFGSSRSSRQKDEILGKVAVQNTVLDNKH